MIHALNDRARDDECATKVFDPEVTFKSDLLVEQAFARSADHRTAVRAACSAQPAAFDRVRPEFGICTIGKRRIADNTVDICAKNDLSPSRSSFETFLNESPAWPLRLLRAGDARRDVQTENEQI